MGNSDYEKWFNKCIALGWTKTENGNNINIRSPRGTFIGYSPKKDLYTSGSFTDHDFTQLIKKVMFAYGESAHAHRVKLSSLKQDVKELRELLDHIADDQSKLVDKWEDAEDGSSHLNYDIGPLTVSAVINPDFSWDVSMKDGGPCDKQTSGIAESKADARFKVLEALYNWAQEVSDSGRSAIKLVMKLKVLLE
jgi:hypothetical protein